VALLEKKQYQRRNRRRIYKKRRRTGLFVFIALVLLTLMAWMFLGGDNASEDTAVVDRVDDPTVAEAPDVLSEEEAAEEESDSGDEETDDDEPTPTVPDDPTLFLSVPKLGISGAIVAGGDVGLELGAQIAGGAPWVPDSNTYIAGHRIGWPGTGSDHIFYSLPAMSEGDEIILGDTLGQEYTYQVTDIFAVSPSDVWVMDPIPGRDVISLQVCTETPDDWWTIGSSLFGGGPESGRLIVLADKV
jgi:sortase A